MAYIFIDDGYPDARDYDSNYVFYDPNDLDQMQQILELIEQRSNRRNLQNTASKRILLNAIDKRRRTLLDNPSRESSGDISLAKKVLGLIERRCDAVSNSLRRSSTLTRIIHHYRGASLVP